MFGDVKRHGIVMVAAFALVALLAACGGRDGDGDGEAAAASNLSGRIEVDGSSTVAPFTTAAAEAFKRRQSGVDVTVGISGTGGGFERFCRGETDLSDASRPIKGEEKAVCEQNGVGFVEFLVANDAITVVVNKTNSWAECLTVEQLQRIWQPGSNGSSWRDLAPSFPDERLVLFGPGTDSGTFDFFTEQIVGEEGSSRSDYSASEDDNVTVQGVAGERGALGYFGLSYFEQNQDKLKAVAINAGDGCVRPSLETAQTGEYKPLSRPLFIYAKKESFERPEVEAFIEFLIENEREIAKDALVIPLTSGQVQTAREELEKALAEVKSK